MKSKVVVYPINVNGITYNVVTTYKSQRGMYLRYKKDGSYVCSAPYFYKEKRVIEFLDKYLPGFIQKIEKFYSKPGKTNDSSLYLLGEVLDNPLPELELKKKALEVFTYLTRKYEEIMNIKKPYKVRARKMTTRYGSNSSKTYSITYNLDLIHYSLDIITSVVIHELCHYYYRDHQKGFNKMLRTYCPTYDECRKKLLKGIYK